MTHCEYKWTNDWRISGSGSTRGSSSTVKANRSGRATTASFEAPASIDPVEEWRRVENLEALRCGPYEAGLYTTPVDQDFDRNRCSTMREGEVVQLLARWPNGMYLARTSYALGWVQATSLSSPVDREAVEEQLQRRESQPFTRRALLTEAFSMLGEPYGWGGKDGGYDCSRFLLDLFAKFGIDLPRHSARQAIAGTFSVDVSTVEDLNEKRLLLEAAARRGVVLLHFPGHIMLYLGTTEEGVPMAIHAFSEFLTPCEGIELETINRVDRIAVSDLSLGAGKLAPGLPEPDHARDRTGPHSRARAHRRRGASPERTRLDA